MPTMKDSHPHIPTKGSVRSGNPICKKCGRPIKEIKVGKHSYWDIDRDRRK